MHCRLLMIVAVLASAEAALAQDPQPLRLMLPMRPLNPRFKGAGVAAVGEEVPAA